MAASLRRHSQQPAEVTPLLANQGRFVCCQETEAPPPGHLPISFLPKPPPPPRHHTRSEPLKGANVPPSPHVPTVPPKVRLHEGARPASDFTLAWHDRPPTCPPMPPASPISPAATVPFTSAEDTWLLPDSGWDGPGTGQRSELRGPVT